MVRVDAQRSREALLDSALELVTARGSVDVTVEDIASYAGVSSATVYRHFGSKKGLMDQVSVDRWQRAAGWAIGSGRPDNALSDIVHVIDNFSRMVSHDSTFITVAGLRVGETPEAIIPWREMFDARFERLWSAARMLGQVRVETDPRDIVELVASLHDQRRRVPKLLTIINGFVGPGVEVRELISTGEIRAVSGSVCG